MNRKSGLREALQRLRRTLDAKLQLALNAAETQLIELESNAGPDETNHQDCQRTLLQLESELGDLATFVPAGSSWRLALLRNRLASFAAKIDQALRLRQEEYAKLLEKIAHAPSRSALANLRISIRQQLPEVHMHSQLQEALRQAEDRLLVTELESMERQERTAHLAKRDSARGVDLANLLFREYGVDLPTARKLVIDRNNGVIDLDGLLDSVVEVTRRTKQRHRGAPKAPRI